MDDALMNEVLAALLRKDSSLAALVLSGYIEEGNQKKLLAGLREISTALGGVTSLAEQAGLNPSLLAHQLSSRGSPSIMDLSAMLKSMGMQLRVRRA